MAALVSNQPVKLQCTRPTQQAACDRAYQQYFGNLPVKVLDCTLQETAAYIALKGKVVAAVNTLNAALGEGSLMVGGNGDPLLVLAESGDTVWKVREYSRQDWGFGPPSSKPGFDYPAFGSKSIDGLSTPGVWHPVDAGKIILPHQDKFGRIKEQLDPSELIVNPMDQVNQVRGSERLQAQLQAKGNVRIQAQMEAGVQAPLQGQQQQPMSGSLPPGSPPPGKGASLSEKNDPRLAMKPPTPVAAKPDLVFTGVPRIGGQTIGWNGMVTLNAARASGRRTDGSCEFLLDYSIRNAGTAPGGPFRITWGNRAANGGNRTVQLLAAGAMRNERDTVVLRPGSNRLNLVLDDQRRVDESNEQNNSAALTITLSGNCGRTPSARSVPPTTPIRPKQTPFQIKN
jgi:hypothetical protein